MEDPRRYMRAMIFIRDRIENGTFKANELMPSIAELAEQTGHSRHTITKALRLLQDEDLVSRTPGLGYVAKVRATTTGSLRPVPDDRGHLPPGSGGVSVHNPAGGHNGSPIGWGRGGTAHGRH